LLVRSHPTSTRYVLKRHDELPKTYLMRASNTWAGTSPSEIVFETEKAQPHGGHARYRHTFAAVDFARFLGWFVSEGNVHLAAPRTGKPDYSRVIELSQRSVEKRVAIEALCRRMGIRLSRWSGHGTCRFQHRALGDWLLRECGHGAAQKRIPAWVRDGSPEVIAAFLETYRLGDGSGRPDGTGTCYHTSSRALADDVQEVLAKIGCAGKLRPQMTAGSMFAIGERRVVRKHDTWTIYAREGMSRKTKASRDRTVMKRQTARVPYVGWVWCVSTPHHTIYVRRKGIPMWSGNSDANVIRFRRGRDARSIPAIRIPGELTRDPSVLTNRLADVLTTDYNGQRVDMLFLDSAGIAGAVGARLRAMGHRNVVDVNFGADSPDPTCRYLRDFMWQKGKEWLLTAAIDTSPQLESDLTAPGLREDLQQRVWLESKKQMKARGVASTDDADALFLTLTRSLDASTQGMIYATILQSIRADGHVTQVPYDQTLRVDTDWHVGLGETSAVWFSQSAPSGAIYVIDYYEATGEALPHYVEVLRQKGYTYGTHWAPDELQVSDLGTGRSRLSTAHDLGLYFQLVPRLQTEKHLDMQEGIEAVRVVLGKCWFDATRCKMGLEALRQYRWGHDAAMATIPRPVQDWTSPAAEAFRTLAVRYVTPGMPTKRQTLREQQRDDSEPDERGRVGSRRRGGY
ncbi:MAG: LAGLIDADG family homing endonuclease, partial [Burkholderiales bacterium]